MLGRPPIYATAEELETKIQEYFIYIQGESSTQESEPEEGEEPEQETIWKREPEFPSISGLAYYLGFESRQSFYDYEQRGDFSYTVKRARLKIESFYEQGLNRQSPTGAIFALKNFGWKDRQEIDMNAKVQPGFMNIDPLADEADKGTAEDSATQEA